MNELSLFSGAGGGLLGTKLLGFNPIGYVEYNTYCQRIIAQRIKDGLLENAPIFGDIRTFISDGYAESYQGMVDIITAGFPCQPFSVAGKQAGEKDDRNMWPETIDVIRTVRPKYVLLENVPGLLAHEYIKRIFSDLVESGNDIRWRSLSAAELGAPHKRNRIWIVAYPNQSRGRSPKVKKSKCKNTSKFWNDGQKKYLADTYGEGFPFSRKSRRSKEITRIKSHCNQWRWWETEPGMGRVANGVANRVDRLKALGNGQVPEVVRTAWELLTDD